MNGATFQSTVAAGADRILPALQPIPYCRAGTVADLPAAFRHETAGRSSTIPALQSNSSTTTARSGEERSLRERLPKY